MHISLQPLLLSAIAPICWGISWLFLTKASRKMDVFHTQFMFQLVGIPMLLLLLPFLSFVTITNYWLIIALGIAVTFTYTLYFYAMRIGKLAVVAPIYETNVLVTVCLSVVFLHESFYPRKEIAIVALLLGIIFLGVQVSSLKKKRIEPFKGVLPAIISSLGTGFFVYFTGISARINGWYPNALGIRMVIPVVIIIVFLIQRKKIQPLFHNTIWKWILPAAVFDVIAFSMFNYTFGKYEVSYVSVIAAATPVISTILAILFLKERLTLFQIMGFLLVVCGIIFLNIV